MTKKKGANFKGKPSNHPTTMLPQPPMITSILDHMIDGREFESLVGLKNLNVDVVSEIRKSLKEISEIRKRPVIAYLANLANPNIKSSISIEITDDLPFTELVNTAPASENVDVIVVTPGGSGEQVAKFVDKLRRKFKHVSFIIPDMAMSAGTILAMSGDEIIMTANSYIGPIDPQVRNRDGQFVPAQAINTLIKDIQERGQAAIAGNQQPQWTDLQILRQLDPKEIGSAISWSNYSIELVENYLFDYKFKTWKNHSNGQPVTDVEKRARAKKIASDLCDHSAWKSHKRGITREVAWEVCKLKINHSEDTPGLDRAIRRFSTLMYWFFENSIAYKAFISENYFIMRNDQSLKNKA
jgi:hypothetical protein